MAVAIAFFRRLGAERLRAHNRRLALEAARMLLRTWRKEPPAPPSMLASMVTIELPGSWSGTREEAGSLHDELADGGIEAQITPFAGKLWARVSAQAYNALDDYEALGTAIDARGRA